MGNYQAKTAVVSHQEPSMIIINHANYDDPRLVEKDKALINDLKRNFRSIDTNTDVHFTKSFEQINEILARDSAKNVLAIFSNCPPDSSYKTVHTLKVSNYQLGGPTLTMQADGYEKSKLEIRAICIKYPNIPLYVVTGAPNHILSDHTLLDLTKTKQIIVKRKDDFFAAASGFERAYYEYIIRETLICKKSCDTKHIENWRDAQRATLKYGQVGRIRVLLCHRNPDSASQLSNLCTNSFDTIPPVFNFITARDYDEAHKILTEMYVEMIVAVLDDDYWFALMDVQSEFRLFGSFYIASKKQNVKELSYKVKVIWLDDQSRLTIQGLLIEMLASVDNFRETLRENNWLSNLQSQFLLNLQENETEYPALRWFAVNQSEFVRAFRESNSQISLFLPVASLADMRKLVRKAMFIADRVVFTFSTFTQLSERIDEHPIFSMAEVWDIPNIPMLTVYEPGLRSFLLEHKNLLKDGRIYYFPSPSLINVDENNVEDLQPLLRDFLPKHRVASILSSEMIEEYISASKIDAYHVLLNEYKPLSDLGKTLATFEIPYIENLPIDVLRSIVSENSDSLQKFQERVRWALEDILDSGSDPQRELTKKRFAREILDSSKELNSRLESLHQSTALETMGAVFLTSVTTLSAMSLLDIPESILTIMGGGGLGSLGIQLLRYLMELRDIKKSPFYIVWKMGRY